MNYRHAFHAGNFADVIKHIVLVRSLLYLMQKPTPLRFVDTHSGIGLYDLQASEATRTGEWHHGVEQLWLHQHKLPMRTRDLLAPYLEQIKHFNPEGSLRRYPGSPILAQALLRADDRLNCNELHAEDVRELAASLGSDRRIKITDMDGYAALKAQLPPPEKRGLILIDPPYEAANERHQITAALLNALNRFATGVYLVWYPIKEMKQNDKWRSDIMALTARHKMKPSLNLELLLRAPRNTVGINGAGLFVLNPPHTLEDEMRTILSDIDGLFGQEQGHGARVNVLNRPV